ncbi:MAG: hypothetical protein R2724_10160 [Bryobacterales bacterium]
MGQKKLIYFWEDGRTEFYDLDGDVAESHPLDGGRDLEKRLLDRLDDAGARKPTRR